MNHESMQEQTDVNVISHHELKAYDVNASRKKPHEKDNGLKKNKTWKRIVNGFLQKVFPVRIVEKIKPVDMGEEVQETDILQEKNEIYLNTSCSEIRYLLT